MTLSLCPGPTDVLYKDGDLVWAQLEEFPWWPATVEIDEEDFLGAMVTVRWLGIDSDMTNSLPRTRIRPFSEVTQAELLKDIRVEDEDLEDYKEVMEIATKERQKRACAWYDGQRSKRKRLKLSHSGGKTLPGTRIREMQEKHQDRLPYNGEHEDNREITNEGQDLVQQDDTDFIKCWHARWELTRKEYDWLKRDIDAITQTRKKVIARARARIGKCGGDSILKLKSILQIPKCSLSHLQSHQKIPEIDGNGDELNEDGQTWLAWRMLCTNKDYENVARELGVYEKKLNNSPLSVNESGKTIPLLLWPSEHRFGQLHLKEKDILRDRGPPPVGRELC